MTVARVLTATAVAVALGLGSCGDRSTTMVERFDRPDGLVTNEWASSHPDDDRAVLAEDWWVTSGSLFAVDGVGWTGEIDAEDPGPTSGEHTNSAVLRALTDRGDFEDVWVSMEVRHGAFVSPPGRPPQDYDGLHLALRYQDPANTYYVSVYRRDGTVTIKKKTSGGEDPVNGGSYETLAAAEHPVPEDWSLVETGTFTRADGSVVIRLVVDGELFLEAVDDRATALTEPGHVGIRADNTELRLDDLAVAPVDVDRAVEAAPAPDA